MVSRSDSSTPELKATTSPRSSKPFSLSRRSNSLVSHGLPHIHFDLFVSPFLSPHCQYSPKGADAGRRHMVEVIVLGSPANSRSDSSRNLPRQEDSPASRSWSRPSWSTAEARRCHCHHRRYPRRRPNLRPGRYPADRC
jgi:hypothetical protein